MSFIQLPQLRYIAVENFSLFDRDWDYSVKEGQNLFLGANGLGKTTTTSLVIYGMVGFTSKFDRDLFKVEEDYFKRRGQTENENSTVTIHFIIQGKEFQVSRQLSKDEITSFTLSGISIPVEEYEERLKEYTKIESLEDLAFILEFFLIREEEGNYLLWDFRDQSRIIQLLISPVGFRDKYEQLTQTLTKEVSEINRKSDTELKTLRKRLEELENLRDQELEASRSGTELEKVQKEKSDIESKLGSLGKNREVCLSKIEYLVSSLKDSENKSLSLSADLDAKQDRILSLERMLYRDIYADEKVLMMKHKIKHHNICFLCNQHPSEADKKALIEKIELHQSCPVCSSSLVSEEAVDQVDRESVIAELEKAAEEIRLIRPELSSIEGHLAKVRPELETFRISLRDIDKEINALSIKQIEVDFAVSRLQNPSNNRTQFDSEIKRLSERIAEIKAEYDPRREGAKKMQEELEKLNSQLTDSVNSSLDRLNEIFSKYSASFFRSDVELSIHDKQLKNSSNFERIRQAYYVPFFDGKSRTLEKHCSTSERIFLEYLFRLSLLELYVELSQSSAFIMLETMEGPFDFSGTMQLAETFSLFDASQTPLILVVNLSKPRFVEALIKRSPPEEGKVLNYLSFGRLSEHQEENQKEYQKLLASMGVN